MMKAINMGFPALILGLVFFGVISLTLIANTSLVATLVHIDHQVGLTINGARFPLMDKLSPHIGNYYFWIPFYCSMLLLLAGFDRVKFLRNSLFLGAFLGIAGLTAMVLNLICSWAFPENCRGFHYYYGAFAKMDCSLVCINTVLSFGAASFISLYLGKRFAIVKVSLLLFSLVTSYNLIYLGDDLPVSLLLGMVTGLISAGLCQAWFRRIGGEQNKNKRYEL